MSGASALFVRDMPDHPAPTPAPASPPAPARTRMPLAVYVLGLSVFALGTSEFMLSGILQPLARDMGVSIPQAGLLVSAFAIGMVVGAPVLAGATLQLPRRTTLIGLLTVFGLGQVAGAVAPSYGVLFVSRVVSALACAGFWAVGAAVAVSLVPVTARARAMAVMVGGLSIANIAGVPAGALLGQHAGWRSAFWAVAVLSAIGLIGVIALVPRTAVPTGDERPALRRELSIYRDKQVWLALIGTALNGAAVFALFSYLAPLLTDTAGLSEGSVPTVLALFGVGALIGTFVGGRIADAHPFGTILGGIGASATVLTLLALTAHSPVAAVTLSLLLGVTAFTTAPALNARMFNVAHAAPTLAGATTTSAFNMGNTVGPWLGGLVIGAGWGYPAVAWTGALLAALGVVTTVVALRLHRARSASRVVASSQDARRAPVEASDRV
ncbi:MFS transporter [Streptomyces rimosus subsp. rimosus ATCC 10970]|uniref:MFS transporter n=2 Tax=Streptomyces rimosus subsp. rimosus TaxID=132474 RepID=A0A8A1URS3_STRR1|nr:Cmx/CmrA family chloramphenicol efflux MFS transporter [Streptomyces sp. SID5471]QDA05047.1 MFS transporter [Streptomyces rimosus]QGY66010.1 Cmx/CmrA family chloramphenicol efflux MFS transporter [Streptomyces rimosus R6-500]QST82917.1 MFS transporter [Streptomyces rimosus subsp. rimosus ATCC 10970]QTL87150.1 MFS transporter [Streptomyces rimosus subsp. rimosus]